MADLDLGNKEVNTELAENTVPDADKKGKKDKKEKKEKKQKPEKELSPKKRAKVEKKAEKAEIKA